MDQEKKIIMGKNAKIIIFSLIGLAVLGGVAAVLMLTAPADKPQDSGNTAASLLEAPKTTSEASAAPVLCKRAESEAVSIDVTNPSGSFTIVPAGESDGKTEWTIFGLENAPLDTDSIAAAAGYAVDFEASEFVIEVSDSPELEKYGLAEPAAEITAKFSDNTEFTLKVGNEVPNKSSYVYVTPDDRNVYTAMKSKTSGFTGKALGFVKTEAVPAYDTSGDETVLKMTVERVDLPEPIVIESIETDEESGDTIQVYSYRLTSPYTAYADLTDSADFIYGLFGLTAVSAESVDPSESDIETAGLNNPNCVVTVETNKKTYTLTVGAAIIEKSLNDEGEEVKKLNGFYGMTSEVPNVIYKFDGSSIPSLTVQPQEIMSKLFLMPYIYSLDSIDYSDSEGRKINIGIETIKSADEEVGDIHKFTVNGETWDEQACKDIYQYLISASGEELYFDEDKGDLIAEIVYNYKDKADGVDGRDTVRIYSSNTDRKIILNLNGENLYKARQIYATQLLKNTESFLNGGTITLTY